MQEVLARTIREEKEIYIGNEEVKLYVVTDDIILYMENPKASTHTHTKYFINSAKLLDLKSAFNVKL